MKTFKLHNTKQRKNSQFFTRVWTAEIDRTKRNDKVICVKLCCLDERRRPVPTIDYSYSVATSLSIYRAVQ